MKTNMKTSKTKNVNKARKLVKKELLKDEKDVKDGKLLLGALSGATPKRR